jgi:hypothetical protein
VLRRRDGRAQVVQREADMNPLPFKPYLVYSAPLKVHVSKRVVHVASDDELCRTSHVQRLAMSTVEIGLSRRKLADEFALVIYGFEGQVLWPNGGLFGITEALIDDAFGSDPEFRWLSAFLTCSVCPPRQRPQRRILPRLCIIDLYHRIEYAGRARLISK